MNRIDQALDLSKLTVSEKDGLILRLATRVKDLKRGNATLGGRVSDLEGRLREPAKTPDNSSEPHQDQPGEVTRRNSWGRGGGGWPLSDIPDQFVLAKASGALSQPLPMLWRGALVLVPGGMEDGSPFGQSVPAVAPIFASSTPSAAAG